MEAAADEWTVDEVPPPAGYECYLWIPRHKSKDRTILTKFEKEIVWSFFKNGQIRKTFAYEKM